MLATAAVTTTLSALIWLVLTGGDPTSWIVGIPVIMAVNLIVLGLGARVPKRIKWQETLHFAWFFLYQSVRSGLDVAYRVIQPTLAIDPGRMRYRTKLDDPTARAWFMTFITMLPGTLSVQASTDEVDVHLLDQAGFDPAELGDLEDHVANMFSGATRA